MQEYGALMAQVIPVVLLAFLLELRVILEASRAERDEFVRNGIATREQELLSGWRRRLAEALQVPYQPESRDDAGNPVTLHNRMSGIDAFGFVWIYGFVMLLLVRAEIVSLALAQTGEISTFETFYLDYTVVVSLTFLIIVAVGLELYRNFGGSRWPRWLFTAYGTTGIVIGVIFGLSLVPTMISMAGGGA